MNDDDDLLDDDIPPEQVCDDCWSDFAMVWSFPDKRRRCQPCNDLHNLIITGQASPSQLAYHSQLLGVST